MVYSDLYRNDFKFKKFHLHTKIVLVTSLILIGLSALSFYYMENKIPNWSEILNSSCDDYFYFTIGDVDNSIDKSEILINLPVAANF